MPFLPKIDSDYVYKGMWINYTVPVYRKYIWTSTNLEALIYLGILGILGTIAGDRSWLIMRHYLQPAVQLPDSDNKRLTLSRTHAIKAVWAEIKYLKEDLKDAWNEGYGNVTRVKVVLDALKGNRRQTPRTAYTSIEMRFGVCAILNLLVFAFLGIFIPFSLSEGMQGEPSVRAIRNLYPKYLQTTGPIVDELVRRRVDWDFNSCVTDRGDWNRSDYCVDLRTYLPQHRTEEIDLAALMFTHSPYKFLLKNGDAEYKALKFSQNTTLQHVGVNTKPGGTKLQHELTCVPASLDQLIIQVNGSFRLAVPELLPELLPSVHPALKTRFHRAVRDNMVLKTSNSIGTGYTVRHGDYPTGWEVGKEPVVDSALPWVDYKKEDSLDFAVDMIRGLRSTPQQNFLITFKPSEASGFAEIPSDDPIFGTRDLVFYARYPNSSIGYSAAREVTALACAEVFKICSDEHCREPAVDTWEILERNYAKMMSVWLSALIDNIYGVNPISRNRHFFDRERNPRQRWQEEVEERFIRSMLRVLHASKHGAEQDLIGANWWYAHDLNQLLYVNPAFTNINFLGYIATVGGYILIIAASHWIVILSPITATMKLLVWSVRTGLGKVKDMFDLVCLSSANWVDKIFARAKQSPSMNSNTLRMDTLHAQDSDEPDNPPTMTGRHG